MTQMRAHRVWREEQSIGGVAICPAVGDQTDDPQLRVGQALPTTGRTAARAGRTPESVLAQPAGHPSRVLAGFAVEVGVERRAELGDRVALEALAPERQPGVLAGSRVQQGPLTPTAADA